jgi:phosphoglycerate dehydrogenase-like enzyme
MTNTLAGPDIRRVVELGGSLTVLVPDDLAVSMFAEVAGIRTVRYRLGEELPPEAAFAEVLVPPFDGYRTAVELLDRLPGLRLVQLPGAGADVWLDRLPPGVRLATARGAHSGSVAEWVVAELGTGRLRAALDVTDPEPLPADHPLWTLHNVVLTPHVAGLPAGFLTRAYRIAVDEVTRFRDGQPLRNLVTGDY